MNVAASDVYEIVLEDPSGPTSWLRSAASLIFGLLSMGSDHVNPGGMIISVIHQQTGEELFRHIEDMGDDEGHLLDGIHNDLATMSAHNFKSRWVDE